MRVSAHDHFVDCENNDVHLLTRIMFAEPVVGAAYLLGNLYAITEERCKVMVYTGHSPYDLIDTIPVEGMIAVDIATSYVDVCVYVLDNGNGQVLRIDRKHKVNTFIDGLERGKLLSMSVTSDGRITIVHNSSRILIYDKDGKALRGRSVPIEGMLHAVEVAEEALVVCEATSAVKITNDGKWVRTQGAIGCRYVDMNRDGYVIACDWSGHQVVMLSSETLEVIATLLTLDRDGIESPRHVRYVPENGLMLVSWLNFLDVYSFRQSATQGYLASPESDIRNQRIREANELQNEIMQSPKVAQAIMASEMDSIFRQLPSHPHVSGLPDKSTIGKESA